jgi:dTDP-4-dehydrorhamnose reductase
VTIADIFGCDKKLITVTTSAQMFQNRAPAPQYAALHNDKILGLGVVMRTFREGLEEVKKQEAENG